MGPGTTFEVLDQMRSVVRTFSDPYPEQPFMNFIGRASKAAVSYTDFVVDYTESFLNFVQMKAWLSEFPTALDALDATEDEREVVGLVLAGVAQAEALNGYFVVNTL
jgi:hypothetical protein